MKHQFIFIGLILGLFVTCKSTANQNTNSNSVASNSDGDINLDDILISKSVDTSGTFFIKDDCVFVIQMSTKESDSLETLDPVSYESFSEKANDDAMNASELLGRLNIKTYWSDKRYVRVDIRDRKYVIDTRLKDLAGQYCLMLKNNKKPELILLESLTEEELTKYFKK